VAGGGTFWVFNSNEQKYMVLKFARSRINTNQSTVSMCYVKAQKIMQPPNYLAFGRFDFELNKLQIRSDMTLFSDRHTSYRTFFVDNFIYVMEIMFGLQP